MKVSHAWALLTVVAIAACGGRARDAEPDVPALTPAPIPPPTGPFPVASLLLDVDDPRPAEALPEGLPRVVEAQVWYPAARDAGGERMPYFPRHEALDRMIARGYLRQPAERLVEWSRWSTVAERDGLAAVPPRGFPLLVFTPSAPMPVQQYTALLQELASRGFIVIGVEPRVARPPVIRRSSLGGLRSEDEALRASDLSLVLRRFVSASGGVGAVAQRADLTRAGVFGHGTGGAVVIEACTQEAVLRRCASLDGRPTDAQMRRPLPLPLLVLRSGTALDDATTEAETRARWLTLFARADAAARLLRIDGAGYMSATDAPWVMPDVAEAAGAGADAERLLDVTASLLASFFGDDREAPFAAVDSLAIGYEELLVES